MLEKTYLQGHQNLTKRVWKFPWVHMVEPHNTDINIDINIGWLWKQTYMESLFARMLQGMALFARLSTRCWDEICTHSSLDHSLSFLG